MSDQSLTRDDLLAHGFSVVEGTGGTKYSHPCGLEVWIPTYPQFDNHEKEPWWWSMVESYTLLPRRLNPKTVVALRHLLALADPKSDL